MTYSIEEVEIDSYTGRGIADRLDSSNWKKKKIFKIYNGNRWVTNASSIQDAEQLITFLARREL